MDRFFRPAPTDPLKKQLGSSPPHQPGILGNGGDPRGDQICPAPVIKAAHAEAGAYLDLFLPQCLQQLQQCHAVHCKGSQALGDISALKPINLPHDIFPVALPEPEQELFSL